MLKRAVKKVTINFTPEEHELLVKIAARDMREKATEVRWLVESYANGGLISVGELRPLLAQHGKEIPVLQGALDESGLEGKPEPGRQPKKVGNRHEK